MTSRQPGLPAAPPTSWHTSQTLPRPPSSGGAGSYTWAEVTGPDGHIAIAELVAGEGVRSTAAIAAETTRRVLAGVAPGAWTPGQLFGAALVTDATGAQVTVNGQPT